MYVVAKVLSETAALPCHFHIGKNVRGKHIMNCKVKPNSNDVKFNRKEVKEEKNVKASDIVNNIMRVWDDVVEYPTKDSYASAVIRFRDV
jgi:hypothetical protein